MNGREGYLYLAALVLIWGLAYPLTKLASMYASPMVISLFRTGLGSMLMYPVARRVIINRQMLVSGLLNIGLFLIFLNLSIMLSANPGLSAVLVYTQPLFVAALESATANRRPPLPRALAMATGFLGILLTAWGGFNLGNAFALLAGLSWALGTIYYSTRVRERSAAAANESMTLLSVPIIAALTPLDYSLRVTAVALLLLVAVAVLAQALGFLLWFKSLSLVDPSLASSILLATPIAALAFSYLILGSPLTLLDGVGAAVTLSSVVFIMSTARR